MLTTIHNGVRLYLDPHSGTCVDYRCTVIQKPKHAHREEMCICPLEVKRFLDQKAREWFGI